VAAFGELGVFAGDFCALPPDGADFPPDGAFFLAGADDAGFSAVPAFFFGSSTA
jgi:hypothetical protein